MTADLRCSKNRQAIDAAKKSQTLRTAPNNPFVQTLSESMAERQPDAAAAFVAAIKGGAEKLIALGEKTPADKSVCLGQELLTSFVATLDEDQSALLLMSLFGIPSFGELLDRHLSDAINHIECRAVAEGETSLSGPKVSDLIGEG